METAFLRDISTMCMITACVLVFFRWLWLQLRLSNTDAFMLQIEKLVRANNTERAIKLCNAIPGEPLGMGTKAVLTVYMSGRQSNETEVIDTFNGALPGGSVRTSLGGFRTFKTVSFFVAAVGLVTHFFGLLGPMVFSQFWITTVAFVVLFGSATTKAVKMERDLFEAVGRLTKLVSKPDEDDPGVDAEEDDGTRGEGHLEIKQAYDDVESCVDEIHAGGIEALLLAAFKKENKIDLKRDEMAMRRIRDAAQKAAVELRHQSETEVNLPFIQADQNGPRHLVVNVNRKNALVFSRRHPPAGMPEPEITLKDLLEAQQSAEATDGVVVISARDLMEKKRRAQASAVSAPAPVLEFSASLASSPGPDLSPSSALPPSALPASAPLPSAVGKAVVCRNCATPIPVEPEILAQIEGEFDLWTKVKTRCPKCGGSFFELKING